MSVAVGVKVAVLVGVDVGLNVAVFVGSDVDVKVAVLVDVGVNVAVLVEADAVAAAAVFVDVGVNVKVGVFDGFAPDADVLVADAMGVLIVPPLLVILVEVNVGVGDGDVAVGVFEGLTTAGDVAVRVRVDPGVLVFVGVGLAATAGEVSVATGVNVAASAPMDVNVGSGVLVAVAVGDDRSVWVGSVVNEGRISTTSVVMGVGDGRRRSMREGENKGPVGRVIAPRSSFVRLRATSSLCASLIRIWSSGFSSSASISSAP